MDRHKTKQFQDFALLIEGSFRAYANKLAIDPPKSSIGQAIYRSFPFTQRVIGRGPMMGGFMGLDPEICRSAVADGSTLPSIHDFEPVALTVPDTAHYHGGVSDSARILGRIEHAQKREIPDLFTAWLAAEKRRDTQSSRKYFVDDIVQRVLGITCAPLPGGNPGVIEQDAWWFMAMEDVEAGHFALAAADVFTAERKTSDPRNSSEERFTDLMLGGRLCGHFEGMAHFPIKEIVHRFNPDTDSPGIVSGEFGRAIATSALKHPNLWTASTEAIVPGLHEHLALAKLTRDPDQPPSAMAM